MYLQMTRTAGRETERHQWVVLARVKARDLVKAGMNEDQAKECTRYWHVWDRRQVRLKQPRAWQLKRFDQRQLKILLEEIDRLQSYQPYTGYTRWEAIKPITVEFDADELVTYLSTGKTPYKIMDRLKRAARAQDLDIS